MEPVVGDKYFVTYKQLGSPRRKGMHDAPGLGKVLIDEADIHFGSNNPEGGFFVRPSKALGEGRFVVVSRQHRA
jgi:hypothetical protein